MRFDRVLQALLPQDKKFFALFEQSTANLIAASELLVKFPGCYDEQRQQLVEEIKVLEHRGDDVTHEIFAELNGTFVTPFDREDIHVLAAALDDVMDHIHGFATRFVLYKVRGTFPGGIIKLIDILHHSIEELHRGVHMLRDLRQADEIRTILQSVNKDENEADDVFERSIALLFEEESDPITIIKMKEIFVALETATDKCEDAANVLESILIKHA